ncbi:MAG: 30S ribosomal protein S12 methylthiotransferase RimO [Lachnospiraceae bacterium]|nr:30S ribosomal protein S12 methylthiotransferase RimO [Lachnospiraceae bacterium]
MKILFTSLGCDKNLVDTEVMLGELAEEGYLFTDEEAEADIVIINTCCFIRDAKEESIETILSMAELKKTGQIRALLVTGCLAQRYREEIQKEIPEVDAVLGITDIHSIVRAVRETLAGGAKNHIGESAPAPVSGTRRIVTTGGHYAYLKIAEGCDKHCTYCIIPKIRGNYRSVPMEDLLEEAAYLASQGVRELILVAQETTVYGVDLYGEKRLPELLRELCRIEGLRWIRLLYCYPEEITKELVEVMRQERKVCHYLDIPIQHASDAVLKRMGRRTSEADLRKVIAMLRAEIPDICLRTTLISGFPGETEEDFIRLYQFVNEMEFDRLGVFAYSLEEDTPAALMPDQIGEEVREGRRNELMELQQEIAFEKAAEKKGQVLEAVVEGYLPEERIYVARTYMDAPNVDGYLFFEAEREIESGSFVEVEVTDSSDYDLVGVEVLTGERGI